MDIILFNKYTIETTYLTTLNRLIQDKECEVCKYGAYKNGCWDCTQEPFTKCNFYFSGIKKIECIAE